MRIFLIVLLIYLRVNIISGQETFKISFDFPDLQLYKDHVELRNGNVLLIGSSHNSSIPPYNNSSGFLYEIRPDGDTTIRSYRLSDTALAFHSIIERDDGKLFILGTASFPPYTEFKLLNIILDTNYQIVTNRILLDTNFIRIDADFLLRKDSIVFLVGKVDYFHHLLVKLDLYGNLLDYYCQSENSPPYDFQDVIFNSDSSKIISFGSGSSNGKISKLITDCSLNIISVSDLPNSFGLNYLTVKGITNDSIYTLGEYYNNQTDDSQISLKVVDSLYNPISQTLFFGTDETRDTPGLQGGIDFRNSDSVFIVGTIGMASDFYPSYYNEIQFTALDGNLNVMNQSNFGGDANYIAETIHECEDGNLIVVATAYDYQNQDNYFDIVLWKLNRQGLFTDIKKIITNDIGKLNLYPNPCFGELNIDVEETPGHLEILNSSNHLIFKRSTSTSKIVLDISDMRNGIYFVRYITKNKTLVNKLIKI